MLNKEENKGFEPKKIVLKPGQIATEFLKMEASGGILLVLAAILALIVANTPLYGTYHYILNEIKFRIGFADIGQSFDFAIEKSVLLWINDGLMAVFFFLVALEIKRELLRGELASKEKVILPAIAALGGIIAPALIFWFFNKDHGDYLDGWAIPAATDIAFALGVLSLLGNRVPIALKVLLTAVAIIDDIAAILIIAVFYSDTINILPLIIGAVCVSILFILNRKNVSSIAPYILIGLILWAAVLKSGVHATLAGVVIAFFIPISCKKDESHSPLRHLEHTLHPWVAFMVLPIFAFANAGVPFAGMTLKDVFNPVTIGIVCGLFFGKQIGIFGAILLTIALRLSPKPKGTNWLQLYAVSVLCGIGFTMSLFIGSLSYDSTEMQAYVRLGVIIASVLAAGLGYSILRFFSPERPSLAKPDPVADH